MSADLTSLSPHYQQRFISAFHGSSVSMLIANMEGVIEEVNDAVCLFLGYSRSELLGACVADFLAPGETACYLENIDKLLAGEIDSFTCEKGYTHRSGAIVYGLLSMSLVRNTEGKAVNQIAQIQDVSEKVRAHKSMKQERQKFEHIFKFSGTGIVLAGAGLQIVEANETLCKLLGYTEQELTRYTLLSITHPADVEMCSQAIGLLLSQSIEKFTLEKRFVHKNGYPISVLATTTRIVDSQGNPYVLAQIQDVNELRKEQLFRQESEERYRHVVQNAPVGIGFSKGKEIIYANPALVQMLGYATFEEYAQNTLPDLTTRITGPRDQPKTKTCKSRQKEGLFSGTFFTKQGTAKILEVRAKSITVASTPYRMAFITDLTEKHNLERKLRETQHVFDLAQKFTNTGSWRWTISTGDLYWSDSIFPLFGLNKKKDRVCYENFIAAVHPEDRTKLTDAIYKCIDSRLPYEVAHRVVRRDGTIRWVQEKGNVIRNSDGQAVEMYGVVRDITAEKRTAEELQESKERYQLLAESGQELICLNSVNGRFLYASPSMRSLLGYHPRKLPPAWGLPDLLYPDDRELFSKLLADAVTHGGEVLHGRFRFRHKNGSLIWCEINLGAVTNPAQEVTAIRSLTRRIDRQVDFETQLIQTNNQLERALGDLKEASEAKENFLSVISHEIRTPLNSVIGLSNLLIRRDPRADQADVLKILKNSADHLMHLVNDILDFNKIRSGNVKLDVTSFSLGELLRNQHTAFQIQAQDKGLALALQIDPQVPDALLGDVTRLNQIFTNLLANAIKFTHQGHVKLTAHLAEKTNKGATVIFTFEDTGVGIAPDKQQSIFQPFHQSETDISRKFGGTGLGLSIVKSLVELMNGKMELQSALGVGSTFKITLHFSLQQKKHRKPRQRFPGTGHALWERDLLQILYVEDVDSNRFLIENLLRDNRMNCLAVPSASKALEETKSRKFDVILMDLQMPVTDGYSTARQIREQKGGKNQSTPIIAFTAEAQSEELSDRIRKSQMQCVICKPFEPDFLIDKIFAHARPTSKQGMFSMSFYENAFNHDVVKIRQIKKIIVSDLARFEKCLANAQSTEITSLKPEIHRIRPVLRNLKCNQLIRAVDQLFEHPDWNSLAGSSLTEAQRLTNCLLQALRTKGY